VQGGNFLILVGQEGNFKPEPFFPITYWGSIFRIGEEGFRIILGRRIKPKPKLNGGFLEEVPQRGSL